MNWVDALQVSTLVIGSLGGGGQRLAEFELEALTECRRAARACLPVINATRPVDSGTNLAVLQANVDRLFDAHKEARKIAPNSRSQTTCFWGWSRQESSS